MAILTRSIGIVLAAAIALDLVFRPAPVRRRLLPALVAGTAVALVGMLWLRVDNATYAGYFERMTAAGLVRHSIDAGLAYAFALVELFGLSFGRLANYLVLMAGIVLIAAGLVQRLRRGPDAVALFVVLYVATQFTGRPAVSWAEDLTADSLRDTLARFRPAFVIEERWRRDDEMAPLVAAFPLAFENPAYRLRAIPAAATGR